MKKIYALAAAAMMVFAANAATEVQTEDLTADMFHQYYSNVDGSLLAEPQAFGCDYNVGVSSGMIYGNGNVKWFAYADITDFDCLVLTVTEGTPRVMYNRDMTPGDANADGVNHVEITAESPFLTVAEQADGSKTYTYDLKAMAAANADKPYVHLNAIKGANWVNATVTSMKLTKTVEIDDPVSIKGIKLNGDAVVYNILGQRVTSPVAGQIYIVNGRKMTF